MKKKKLFSELPTLTGDGITLRPLHIEDASALKELTEDNEVYRYLPTFLFEKKYENTEEVILRLYDEGLKESIGKYAIHIGSITEQVYQKEMEVPIEDMKRYLDGILHLYDEGRTKVSIPELFGIVDQAKQKLIEKGT